MVEVKVKQQVRAKAIRERMGSVAFIAILISQLFYPVGFGPYRAAALAATGNSTVQEVPALPQFPTLKPIAPAQTPPIPAPPSFEAQPPIPAPPSVETQPVSSPNRGVIVEIFDFFKELFIPAPPSDLDASQAAAANSDLDAVSNTIPAVPGQPASENILDDSATNNNGQSRDVISPPLPALPPALPSESTSTSETGALAIESSTAQDTPADTDTSTAGPMRQGSVQSPNRSDEIKTTKLFSYDPFAGTYKGVKRPSLAIGRWVYFIDPVNIPAVFEATGELDLALEPGWNMVGNPFDRDVVLPVKYTAYVLSPRIGDYKISNIIPKGGGAWIEVGQARTLRFNH